MEGERYIKSPETVLKYMEKFTNYKAPAEYLVTKRWDMLNENETPEVVAFFADQDTMSGLFTLSNFADPEMNGCISPFGSGCSSIISYPFEESKKEVPKSILGMYDVSARPFIEKDRISIAIPFEKFKGMIYDMDESFLITDSWKKLTNRF